MNEKIKINVIGDTHGLPFWKELVDDNALNVFVGDYLDAKTSEYRDTQIINLLEILQYKQDNPKNVILLLANHDLPYMFLGRYNFESVDAEAINKHTIFQTYKHLFDGVAYAVGNYLITHAGVTKQWYDRFIGEYNGESATELAEKINELFREDPSAFSFGVCHYWVHDIYGNDEHQSPVWVRPNALCENNLLAETEIVQVVGHTPVENIKNFNDKIYFIDCLKYSKESFVVEIDKCKTF